MDMTTGVGSHTRVAAAILAGALILTGCGKNTGNAARATASVKAGTYKGRDILCSVDPINTQQDAYDCDFAGYYANPSYVAPHDMPRIGKDEMHEEQVSYLGGQLTCLGFQANASNDLRTCDYVLFWQQHPAPAGNGAGPAVVPS